MACNCKLCSGMIKEVEFSDEEPFAAVTEDFRHMLKIRVSIQAHTSKDCTAADDGCKRHSENLRLHHLSI